jgi:redox-sensitive bicupin YhaK (pirin superfamily)
MTLSHIDSCLGFGEHPHREVEICTYVVSGKLTHQDSMGTEETLGRGAIQFMVSCSRVMQNCELCIIARCP